MDPCSSNLRCSRVNCIYVVSRITLTDKIDLLRITPSLINLKAIIYLKNISNEERSTSFIIICILISSSNDLGWSSKGWQTCEPTLLQSWGPARWPRHGCMEVVELLKSGVQRAGLGVWGRRSRPWLQKSPLRSSYPDTADFTQWFLQQRHFDFA